jgi:branched-chain amino acid transport system permease protein
LGLVVLLGLCAVAQAQDYPPEYEGAVKRCDELLPEFDGNPTGIRHEVQQGTVTEPVAVRVDWKRSDAATSGIEEGWIICFFLPRAEANGAWQIDAMDTQKYGKMRRYDVQQLYKLHWMNKYDLPNVAPGEREKPTPLAQALYFLQQTLNVITLGCLYALLAVAFTIVYNVTRVVNLAFGDLYMVGAYVTYISYVLVAVGGGTFSIPVIGIALLATIVTCALASWVTERLAFRPMRERQGPSTMPMVASIGLAIIFREIVRLTQGPKSRWMPPTRGTVWQLTEGLGYDVYLRKGHLLIGLATAVVAGIMWWAGKHTTFGRGYRAAAQDPRMAALLGIDVNRTVGFAFLVAGGMTGVAGIFAALQYQIVDFYMGYVIGFKALAAALLGGIGSLEGAFLGGILIAAVEIYAGMVFGEEWRELAVFSVMALVLIFRPAGLFGTLRNTPADERI